MRQSENTVTEKYILLSSVYRVYERERVFGFRESEERKDRI